MCEDRVGGAIWAAGRQARWVGLKRVWVALSRRGDCAKQREEMRGNGGTCLTVAWISALLSSSSRAISTWPFWADRIKAVHPSCVLEGEGEVAGVVFV